MHNPPGRPLCRYNRCVLTAVVVCLLGQYPLVAKTRWSATQIIPDADFLSGGQFTVGVSGFYSVNESGNPVIRPGTIVRFGVIEWVNIHAGYTGGATFGLKARLLNETSGPVPSVAVGVHNIVTHKEPHFYNSAVDKDYSNEFYLALGKTVEQFKTRFHLGAQTMPTVKGELINGFAGIEKYFGSGLYISFEAHMRDKELHPSLFASYRLAQRKLEISVGAVEFRRIFVDESNAFRVSLNKATGAHDLVRPGIWIGLRYLGDLKAGKRGGFSSIDDRIAAHDERLDSVSARLERIEESLRKTSAQFKKQGANAEPDIVRVSPAGTNHMKTVILEKLMTVRTLYELQPFEPEKVLAVMKEIAGYRERGVPALKEIALDNAEERFIRRTAISVLGEIGDKTVGSALLDAIARTEDPDIKVEIIIALGKLRDTRAAYLLEQLSNDPHDAVAFAAQEMLQKLVKETGMQTSEGFRMRDVPMHETAVATERSLETFPALTPAESGDTLGFPDTISTPAQVPEDPPSAVPAQPESKSDAPASQIPSSGGQESW